MESQRNLSKKHSRTPPKGGRRIPKKQRCEDGMDMKPDLRIGKAKFKQSSVDTLSLTKYFFSDDFHNGLLGTYEIRKNYYMDRLKDTRKQLYKLKNTYHKYYFN